MTKPVASLSLDLDNKWAYLRTHGDPAWREMPSYLSRVAPRVVELLEQHDAGATVFVVGKDLESSRSVDAIGKFVDAGCEIGNHSQSHLPWLADLSAAEIENEIAEAEQAIESLVGARPVGFRAPGFSWSPQVHETLARRGYGYDASVFPTIVGPLARLYSAIRLPSRRGDADSEQKQTFARLSDAIRPLAPYELRTDEAPLVEVPVTTMPFLRLPIHVTYLTFLAQTSTAAARAYLRTAVSLCRLRGVAPSMLLHPLDFLGGDEEPELAFFPGMRLGWDAKRALLGELLESLQRHWRIGTVAEHAGVRWAPSSVVKAEEAATAAIA